MDGSTGTTGGGCTATAAAGAGGGCMRPKSFPLGLFPRGDGELATTPDAGCWDGVEADVEFGAGAAGAGAGAGGADMRRRSLPFPLGGAIVVVYRGFHRSRCSGILP